MKVQAVKVWMVVCPKCEEVHYLMENEFFGRETEWTCLNCKAKFKVTRD